MPAAAGNSHAIQHLEEIKIEGFEQSVRGAFLSRQLAPCIECTLGAAENFIDGVRGIQLFIDLRSIAFISKSQLITQIIETVINGRRRKHQHLGAHAGTNNTVQQAKISVFMFVFARNFTTVAEVVRFVDNNKIIVAPIQPGKVNMTGHAALSGQVGMIKDIITKPILCNRIIDVVALIGRPVFREFLRTKNQNGFIAILVVFNYSKCSEGLTQADAVSKDATVELF